LGYINDNIKKARKKSGLTQDQISKKLKKPRTTYASWEDNIQPSLEDLNKIAKIIKVGIQDLLTENSENIDKITPIADDVGNDGKGESSNHIARLEGLLTESQRQIEQLQKSLDTLLRRQQVIAAMQDASVEALLVDLAQRKNLKASEVRRSVRNRAFSKLGQFELKGIEIDNYT
jgi:transcriptional regulator with XRE-family HTH domain